MPYKPIPVAVLLLPVSLLALLLLPGCALLRAAAGADIDSERFEQARRAAMLEMRAASAVALARRIASGDPVNNADVVVTFTESAVNKAASQLVGARGRLDESTTYVVRKVSVSLYNGAAVASLELDARNDKYDVDVMLVMDCLLVAVMDRDRLITRLEPFNISPDVTAGGLLSGAEEILRDVLKIRLATLGKDLPPMEYPVDFAGVVPVPAASTRVSSGLNLMIESRRRVLRYAMKIKEVLVFEGVILAGLNLTEAREK